VARLNAIMGDINGGDRVVDKCNDFGPWRYRP